MFLIRSSVAAGAGVIWVRGRVAVVLSGATGRDAQTALEILQPASRSLGRGHDPAVLHVGGDFVRAKDAALDTAVLRSYAAQSLPARR